MQFWEFIFNPSVFIAIIISVLLYLLYMRYFESVKFAIQIINNTLKILFKRDKDIRKIELHYSYKNIFLNSYFTVKFEFINAIWFKFKGIATKSRNGEIVLNLENLKEKEIILIVQGLFRKQVYNIEILPSHNMETDSFKVAINQVGKFANEIHLPLAKFIQKPIALKQKILSFKKYSTSVNIKSIKIKLSTFNQNNFL